MRQRPERVNSTRFESARHSPNCAEGSAYPAAPDSEYGWEKLFNERLALAYNRNYALCSRVAPYHNISRPKGPWCGGKENAPAAICRNVAKARSDDLIDILDGGLQTTSLLYTTELTERTLRLMRSAMCDTPINLGFEEMVSINEFVDVVTSIAGKTVVKQHILGSVGAGSMSERGRNCDTRLIQEKLGWVLHGACSKPTDGLSRGCKPT